MTMLYLEWIKFKMSIIRIYYKLKSNLKAKLFMIEFNRRYKYKDSDYQDRVFTKYLNIKLAFARRLTKDANRYISDQVVEISDKTGLKQYEVRDIFDNIIGH